MSIRVTNIQRMCFDDGPGIRTTVFLKGCSLHCPWCSNPETISGEKQEYHRQGQAERGIYGKDYEAEELLEELLKDRRFWGKEGGITFSGGEALLQAERLEPVWKKLKKEGIHLAVETALFVPEKNVELAEKYMDFFFVDVKILEKQQCREVLGGNVEQYLRNVQILTERNAALHFRVPCAGEYVLNAENKRALTDFFKKYDSFPIEIFGIHNLGSSKYEALGKTVPAFQTAMDEELEQLKAEWSRLGCKVEIIKL